MITIEQVIEQCAQLAEGWDSGAPIAKDIRALAAQYEGCIVAGAAAEREACAKVCEDTDIVDFEHCMVLHEDAAKTLTNAAAAIRARSAK